MRIILARALIALLAPSHAYYASRPNNLGASSYASEFHAIRPVPSVDSTLQSTFDRMAPAGHPLSDPLAVFVGDLEASGSERGWPAGAIRSKVDWSVESTDGTGRTAWNSEA